MDFNRETIFSLLLMPLLKEFVVSLDVDCSGVGNDGSDGGEGAPSKENVDTFAIASKVYEVTKSFPGWVTSGIVLTVVLVQVLVTVDGDVALALQVLGAIEPLKVVTMAFFVTVLNLFPVFPIVFFCYYVWRVLSRDPGVTFVSTLTSTAVIDVAFAFVIPWWMLVCVILIQFVVYIIFLLARKGEGGGSERKKYLNGGLVVCASLVCSTFLTSPGLNARSEVISFNDSKDEVVGVVLGESSGGVAVLQRNVLVEHAEKGGTSSKRFRRTKKLEVIDRARISGERACDSSVISRILPSESLYEVIVSRVGFYVGDIELCPL